MTIKKVLITGVYGLIGGEVYLSLKGQPEKYLPYGLARRRHDSDRVGDNRALNIPDERFFLSDLSDLDVLVNAMQDIDCVVHMAADPRGNAPWESVLNSNIIGARNVYEAARIAGVQRVLYASSNTVSWGYLQESPYKHLWNNEYDQITPEDIITVTHEMPTKPVAEYSASKVFGEALGHVYSTRRGLSVICLRIGWVNAEDNPHNNGWGRAGWCSRRDVVQLVTKAIEAPPSLRYDIFYVVSDGAYNWNDTQHAKDVLGYAPQDCSDDYF